MSHEGRTHKARTPFGGCPCEHCEKLPYYRPRRRPHNRGRPKVNRNREIWLRYKAGETGVEIAQDLGVHHSRVYDVISRTRKNLRTYGDRYWEMASETARAARDG